MNTEIEGNDQKTSSGRRVKTRSSSSTAASATAATATATGIVLLAAGLVAATTAKKTKTVSIFVGSIS